MWNTSCVSYWVHPSPPSFWKEVRLKLAGFFFVFLHYHSIVFYTLPERKFRPCKARKSNEGYLSFLDFMSSWERFRWMTVLGEELTAIRKKTSAQTWKPPPTEGEKPFEKNHFITLLFIMWTNKNIFWPFGTTKNKHAGTFRALSFCTFFVSRRTSARR